MALRFNIRPAAPEDRDFVLSIAPRLNEFDVPPWRDRADMNRGDARVLESVLSGPPPKTAVFIAETEDGAPHGFIHLNVETDYYTQEEFGHISDIVVAPDGEGHGVGRALMAAGENWARDRGYRLMTLNVFTTNSRARGLYEKLGYGEDTMKYVKKLS
jgi:ribosomal protein S18 acetylase RimI-like enzyme